MPIFSRTAMAWLVFILIALAALGLQFNASFKEAAIMDELAHIPAGYGYVKYLDFRLNPEHPPLVKALAAFPLLFLDLKFPTDKASWLTDINGQWDAGRQFFYESGNDADSIIQWARAGPILLALLLVFFVYLWAKELLGAWWALLPATLTAFSPTVLAHGHYVTTDIGAALGIFIATYAFVKYLERENKKLKWLLIAGLAFGAAQLMKFSAVLLIPFFLFIAAVFCVRHLYTDGWRGSRHILALGGSLIGIFAIAGILIYAAYFLFTVHLPLERQERDTVAILASFNGGPDPAWETCSLTSSIPLSRRSRCLAELDIWMAKQRLTQPLGQYLLGLMMVGQRASGGNTGYFLGEVSAAGWWYYFPVVFLLKEPLPSLLLIALALLLAFWGILQSVRRPVSRVKGFSDYLGIHLAEFSMLSFIILYWAYSIKSPLNIGVRHVLPTVPFLYILIASQLKHWIASDAMTGSNSIRQVFTMAGRIVKKSAKSVLASVLIAWYMLEALFATPHYLPYFNQLAGGTENGYRYVTDSNYDWGQDLKYLAEWVRERNDNDDNSDDIKRIAVDYFGGGNPGYYLGGKAEGWWSSRGNPKYEGIAWLAVSINSIQGAKGSKAPGFVRKPEDEYSWLKNPYEPYARAGKSIFIYRL